MFSARFFQDFSKIPPAGAVGYSSPMGKGGAGMMQSAEACGDRWRISPLQTPVDAERVGALSRLSGEAARLPVDLVAFVADVAALVAEDATVADDLEAFLATEVTKRRAIAAEIRKACEAAAGRGPVVWRVHH